MKKVLVISYYWPPAGGPGVQRWLKFTKYLRDYQIEPIVVIPENAQYPSIDKSLISEIPSDLQIIKVPISEPYKWARLFFPKKTGDLSKGIIERKKPTFLQKVLLYIRGNFYIPDARKRWVKPVVNYLEDFLENELVDTVITTGPPHSVHLIGRSLKKSMNIQWVADFRDPWTNISYHKDLQLGERARQKHKALENEVLNTADHILVTSYSTQSEFQDKTSKSITVITNGYDCQPGGLHQPKGKFSVAHIGSLLSARNPAVLWEVFRELIIEVQGFKEDFLLSLAGNTSPDVLESIEQYGLKPFLENQGYITHGKALELQRNSQVLLLVEIDSPETGAIIPGKLFEYMAARRPILAIGPAAWDAGEIIRTSDAGMVFSNLDKELIKAQVKTWYGAYKNNNLIAKTSELEQYSRKALTKKLAGVLS